MKISVSIKNIQAVEATKRQMQLAVLSSNLVLAEECKIGTPIETGFARASWWIQANGAPGSNPSPPSDDGGSQASASFNAAVALAAVGGVFSIVNSAKYIRRLEYDGHSAQNVGWVNRAAARYPDIFAQELAKAKARG